MRERALAPVHPGQLDLREEFLAPAGLSTDALAKALRVPRRGDVIPGQEFFTRLEGSRRADKREARNPPPRRHIGG